MTVYHSIVKHHSIATYICDSPHLGTTTDEGISIHMGSLRYFPATAYLSVTNCFCLARYTSIVKYTGIIAYNSPFANLSVVRHFSIAVY